MGERYFCQHRRRRQAVYEHPTLNGIDYLEVISGDQRTLLVRFLKELPETLPFEVRVEGGVRIAPIRVLWAARADIPPAGFPIPVPVEAPQSALLVHVNMAGDFSPYRLRLVAPDSEEVPSGLDPILSQITFSFKSSCPNPFDCRQKPSCPPPAEKAPEIDYLAKDYASFRQLLLDRLAVLLPDWRERSLGDLGMALVELLAYAGDYLSYYQDATATEAYLGTARQRASVRRHARLLDYPMHEGCNARAWVAFQVSAGADGRHLPQGTKLLTQMPADVVVAETQWQRLRAQHGAEGFELMHDLTLRQAHNEIRFYTWKNEACCLPKGATQATLIDNNLELQPGDVLLFVEQKGPETGLPADADPTHRHAVRLTHVQKDQDPLTGQSVVHITWHPADALPFPLCLSTVIGDRLVKDISLALGNIALADHGLWHGEALPPPGGHLRYRPRLQKSGLTFRESYNHEWAKAAPASLILRQDPKQALPAIELRGEKETWRPQKDLLASDRFAAEFVVEIGNDGHGRLRFGDGVHGHRPPVVSLRAEYRVGNGRSGNVGANAIAHVVGNFHGIERVFNPLPAQGGIDPEPLERVRRVAPQAFRVQERAVTASDWAEIARRHPEVQRAVARRRWTGSWYTWFLAVDRKGGRPVDASFKAELQAFLERFRLAGHDLEIGAPRFVPLEIVLTVCVEPGFYWDRVKQALLEVFSSRDLPDGRRGFFHPDHFTFGQPVYYSAVIAAAMKVPGVRWVDGYERPGSPNRFRRWGQAYAGEAEKGQIEIGPLEIARLDNDPNRPENGRIDFVMEGGL